MADKSLYDVLEVGSDASAESIRAAFDRLSAKFDPDRPDNATNPQARIQHDAVRTAFLRLSDPEKRRLYDLQLERTWAVFHNVEVVQPFWTVTRLALIALAIAVGAGAWYGYQSFQEEQVRLAKVKAEMAIAKARAKADAEAAEEAAARAEEQARKDLERQRIEAMDDNERREYEARQKAEQCRLRREATGDAFIC